MLLNMSLISNFASSQDREIGKQTEVSVKAEYKVSRFGTVFLVLDQEFVYFIHSVG